MGLSKKQKQILTFPKTNKTALICDGAVRSGKTSVMALSFLLWVMHEFNGTNFAICGKSVKSAERNVIVPLIGMTYFPKNGFTLKYSASNHLMTVTKGSKTNYIYVFGGKDESSYQLIQGITLGGVMLDEVALMPRSFVEQALARCSVEGARFWFNCNPENPAHWFYEEWIVDKEKKKSKQYLHFLMEDNPSLSQEVLDRYKTQYTGVFYERYVLGRWVMAEGLVYDFFRPDVDPVPSTALPSCGTWYISIDYGTANPCSMGLWCIADGKAYRVDEYYHDSRKARRQHTDEEYYRALEDLAGDREIEAVIVDPSAASFIETIRRHGRFTVYKAKNDVLDGIRITASLLRAGRVLIGDRCQALIGEMQAYSWDDKASGDAVIKEYDHACDDMRYICNTILRREFRWESWGAK